MDQIPMPSEAERIEIDGLSIRYVRGGSPAGVPLVLLSPWPESIYAYAPSWPYLTGHFSITAIDLPGFGLSDGRADLYSPRAVGEFLQLVTDALGIWKAHAVGPDIGTAALLFAEALHPGTFTSIQVGGGAAAFPLRVTGLLKDFIDAPSLEAFAGADPAEIVSGAVRGIPGYDVPDFVVDDYVASYAGRRFVDSIAYVRRYPEELEELSGLLPDIQTPVQFLAAKNDPYLSLEDPHAVAAALPHARVVELENSHNAWEESPKAYAALIAAWALGGHAVVS
ncbi:alpha/beta hydrolase [Gryllotalpicola protaetiae]|uniref:Alpha/beta hydrolase n=2 Tax=Gryllotalpicola protaetiae TaxID=2419771 RepID=A0A387BMM9_9MICO|nr:alpha/beta hydrolase [Gryllotalpicola protaetiae]